MAESSSSNSQDCNQQCFQPSLSIQRFLFVTEQIELFCQSNGEATSVADLGCNTCRLVVYLKRIPQLEYIRCVDIDRISLENLVLKPTFMDYLTKRERKLTIELYEGSILEADARFATTDIVTCIEVIEHLEPEMIEPMVENVFGFIQPKMAIFTTPNFEYNRLIVEKLNLPYTGKFRNGDHKFEWSRAEFNSWCQKVCGQYRNYSFTLAGVGQLEGDQSGCGHSTQIGIFTRHQDRQPQAKPTEPYNFKKCFIYG